MGRAEFVLLGPVEIRSGGKTVPVGGALSRSVLAMLLLEANRAVSVEQIVDAAWAGQPPASARVQVQNRVSALRRLLPDPFISTQGSGYAIRIEEDQLDSARFLAGAHTAAALEKQGDPRAAGEALAAALGLWRGPALDGLTTPHFQAAAQHLEEQRLLALEQRIRLDLALHRHHEVIPEVSTLVSRHPFRESLHAMLMLALFRAGRQADALDAFRAARDVIAGQLGIEPGAVLQRMHTAVLRGDASIDDLGFEVPVRVSAPVATPQELPADVAGFTGRAELLEVLSRQHGGIVAVTGSAGVGKTALAVHWARRAAHRFPDGQLYVDLHGYSAGEPAQPIVVLGQLLRSLGVPPTQVPLDTDGAAAVFRSTVADRKVLILLDNASGADQVRPLLPGGSGTLAIVTSRDRLTGLAAREGALRVPVDVLRGEESLALLSHLLGPDRVAAEAEAAVQLAEICAHLPLALRVTAATLIVRPHRTIADQVSALRTGDRLTALTADDDEQAAVRAAFDLSYQAIPEDAQRVFRLFGVVPGPDLTAEAVAAMLGIAETAQGTATPGSTGPPEPAAARELTQPPEPAAAREITATAEAERLLQRLAAEHLVHEHAYGRYATHDLLRTYAREHAAADPASPLALERLLNWYLTAADAADRLLYPERSRTPLSAPPRVAPPRWEDAAAASAWFDDERAGLIAAVHHAAQHGPYDRSWQLAETLGGYFYLRRYMIDWLRTMGAGLAAAERDEASMSQAVINLSLAIAHRLIGDNVSGADHAERASTLARKVNWLKGEAVAHSVIASLRWQAGELWPAVTELNRCLSLYREIGEVAGQATNLSNLGVLFGEIGDLSRAIVAARRAMSLLTESDRVSRAKFGAALGNYLLQSGRFTEAERVLREALATSRELNDRGNVADILSYLAELALHAGRRDEAVELAGQAMEVFDEIHYVRGQATGSDALGRVHRRLGNHELAIEHHERAHRIAERHGFRFLQAQALAGLAEAYAARGEPAEAKRYAGLVLQWATRSGYQLLARRARTVLAGF